ncbi:uncharacterized protein LOC131244166 isoform X3 [Magnolia sinica]|uniref:uncharacterized protein LOC131244166 isoform X3 n=1 Tax=Magnolia sinica TaxID=86752 RepID=UPI0026584F94|nr:uncharacterized protein LOC131244166 isoform X3 [Magnolia sinica]
MRHRPSGQVIFMCLTHKRIQDLTLFCMLRSIQRHDIAKNNHLVTYSVAQFRFLERLLIVHGHWCYKRITQMGTFTLCRVIKRNDLGQRTIYLQGESKSKGSISSSIDDLTPRFSTDVLRTSEESTSQARTMLNGSNDSTLISSSSEVSSGIELQRTMTEIDQTSPLFSSYLASDTLKMDRSCMLLLFTSY